MKRWLQAGFTFIELIIVLALTSLLIAGVLAGHGGSRKEASFSAAVDKLKNQMREVQNEAQHSVKTATTAAGNSDSTVFGKYVRFTQNSSTYTVSTLIADANDPSSQALGICDTETKTLEGGVQYTGAQDQGIIFTKNPDAQEQGKVYITPRGFDDTSNGGLPEKTCPQLAQVSTYQPDTDNDGFPDATDSCPNTPGGPGSTDGCPPGPPPPPPPPAVPLCSDTVGGVAYTCGLYAQYYQGTGQSAARLKYSDVDDQIGPTMGGANNRDGSSASSWGDFLPTLASRTGQPQPQYASVHWQGDIHLTAGSHNLCTHADDGSRLTVNISGSPHSFDDYSSTHPSNTEKCTNAFNVPAEGWFPITVDYDNNWTHGLGGSAIILHDGSVGNDGDPVPKVVKHTDLRVSMSGKPVSPSLPSWPQGLDGFYYSGSSFNSYQAHYIDDIGTGLTWPQWINTFRTRANDNVTQSVAWYGYINLPTDGNYSFCTSDDDGSAVYWPESGTYLTYNWPGTPKYVCSITFSSTAGQHPIYIYHNNNCGCGAGDGAAFIIQYSLNGAAATEVPHSWFSTWSAGKYSFAYDSTDSPLKDIGRKAEDESIAQQTAKRVLDKFVRGAYAAYTVHPANNCAGDNCLVRLYSNYSPSSLTFNSPGSNGVDFEFTVPGEPRKGWININTQQNSINRVIE